MSILIELAERCERANGPDRQLDVGICLAVGDYSKNEFRRWCGMQPKGSASRSENDFLLAKLSTRYTGLIDDAMKLVPDGYAIERMMIWPGNPVEVSILGTVKRPFGKERKIEWPHTGGDGKWTAKAATPANALCAAALRALAANPADLSKGAM